MPKLQSQLALYGAIDEALVAHDDPAIARRVERFLPGTTGFGQRGWYREVRSFLDNVSTDGRVAHPDLEAARAELIGAGRTTAGLPAAVTARSILAEVVLENMDRGGGQSNTLGPLAEILSVAPTPTTKPTRTPTRTRARMTDREEEPGRVGEEAGAELARRIQTEVTGLSEFKAFLNAQSDDTIGAAVATYEPKAFLRKVRGEYCSVITTEAEWPDITFDELRAVADPQNWDDENFYGQFFCLMTQQGETPQGWSAVLEEVSGDCAQYSLTTPLKFWKKLGNDDLFLNYDLDETNTADADRLVLVDSGYVWISRVGTGVRLRTSKELLIRGLSSTATTAMAGGMGWADNASGMFRQGAKNPPVNAAQFIGSTALAAPIPAPSTPFPVDPPTLPADIRREGVDDTVHEWKAGIDGLAEFGTEFAARWSNGLDSDDVTVLCTRLGGLVTERSLALFDTMASNFRPGPITSSSVP